MLGLRMVTAKKSTNAPGGAVVGRGDHGREPVCECGEGSCRGALDELLGHEESCFWRNSGKLQKDYHNYVYERVYFKVGPAGFSVLQSPSNSRHRHLCPCEKVSERFLQT